MIRAENLVKEFDGFRALDGVTFHVKKGSVYGLLGPNGAGKTTLIKHLAGIYRETDGSISIDGRKIYENTDIKSRTVYIGDELFFFPSYSIEDMAKFYKGIYPRWSDERFHNLSEVFKIDIKRKVRRLSKGMQKQVAFWLGICTCPDVMILDEPVDGLDPVMRRNVWRVIIQDVAEYGTTVLISSHNLRELEDVCDHVGIMHKGKLVLEKSLDDLKGNIHKIQLAFEGDFPDEVLCEEEVLHTENTGRVYTVIVRGDIEDIRCRIAHTNPLICEIIPLSLEEVFIYELGGMGYEFRNIIL